MESKRERERLKGEIAWVERPDIGDRETETGDDGGSGGDYGGGGEDDDDGGSGGGSKFSIAISMLPYI